MISLIELTSQSRAVTLTSVDLMMERKLMLLLWKFKTKTATETENLALEVKSDTVDGKKKRTGLVG